MESSNLVTLIFVVAAVFVFLQLRNVLGKRTGHERPRHQEVRNKPVDMPQGEDAENVITLPGRDGENSKPYRDIDRVAEPGGATNKGLRAIRDADPSFDVRQFIEGARMAYEMIVMAFADEDRRTLQNLLAEEVYEGFAEALDERKARGESVRMNFVGLEDISIDAAELKDNEAHVTVKLVSQLITTTHDSDGAVIDGDPEAVVEVRDVWTFARNVRDSDPNWKLVATEAGE